MKGQCGRAVLGIYGFSDRAKGETYTCLDLWGNQTVVRAKAHFLDSKLLVLWIQVKDCNN